MISLEKKVAVVTGGSNGIGKAISKVFHELGAEVHVLDIEKTSDKKIHFHHCDVSDHQTVGRVFESLAEQSGRLDILVNNAGIASIGTVESTSPEEMDKIYAVNVKSVFTCSHFAIK